jgi:hypothetical protein
MDPPLTACLRVGRAAAPPIATELYDHRGADPFDFDKDGEERSVAANPANAPVLANLTAQLRRQYTWDAAWLRSSRASLIRGELLDDVQKGAYPYNGVLPVPPLEADAFRDEL